MYLPIWLKVTLLLILSVVMILLFVKVYGLYRIYNKYPELVKSLELGEQMIANNNVGENCLYVDFEHYPKLKDRGFVNIGGASKTEAEKFLENVTENTNCIQDAQLIGIEYKNGQASATYTCEKQGVITEFTWTDFEDSCSYMQYLKNWNLPVGYSLLSINRP